MRIITFLSMMLILNFNLQAKEIPQFKNKIAINGDYIYQIDKNGNIKVIFFSYYEDYENGSKLKLLNRPATNTLFFDKINPYNTNELHYYQSYIYNKKIDTNYYTYIIKNDLLMIGNKDNKVVDLNSNDPYDYNTLKAIAICVDYRKYGKKYIKKLMNRDIEQYRARYFEGKYVS